MDDPRFYFPVDHLAFHRPQPLFRKYTAQIPVLKEESRRSARMRGLFLLSSTPEQLHPCPCKLHSKTAKNQVPSRKARSGTCSVVCGEEGRFIRSPQQVWSLTGPVAPPNDNDNSGGHPPYEPMPVILPYQAGRLTKRIGTWKKQR